MISCCDEAARAREMNAGKPGTQFTVRLKLLPAAMASSFCLYRVLQPNIFELTRVARFSLIDEAAQDRP